MLYFTWVPADPDAVRARVPGQLRLAENSQCFINQYVVDTDDQTSGFAPYSLTYAGADLAGLNTPDGAVPGRWWTDYLNSNAEMRSSRGVPASAGETTLEITDGILTATTSADGAPVIRTTVRGGRRDLGGGARAASLHHRCAGSAHERALPVRRGIVQPWEVLSFEFLEANHPVYALRPADPLQVTWGFYSPNASFCYPGGESALAA